MVKNNIKPKNKSSKKSKNKKTKTHKNVIKTIDTVMPISTPVGSVHFDEFLKICREPKIIENIAEPAKISNKTKNNKNKKSKKAKKTKKTEKSKKAKKTKKTEKPKKSKKRKKIGISKIKEVVKPDDGPPSLQPTLFPLINTLLLPSNNDAIDENTLFSEFVVGKPETFTLKQSSIRKLTVIEQQANNTVDEINNLEAKIKTLMEKPKLNESETIELENQQLLVMKLLNDFEDNLAKIRDIFNNDNLENTNETNTDGEDTICQIINKTESQQMNVEKWYEINDLSYLLSPNASFDKGVTVSEGLLGIFEELKNQKTSPKSNAKHNDVFKRLKNKFSILLPPPNLNGSKEYLMWVDKKLYRDHRDMLNGTKNLKIFQCWNELELKYNIINALVISLKDAIKSTSPFYYASNTTKSQFAVDQSILVQSLDELKRKTRDAFLHAGLEKYWKINPESIRLGSRPCFDITICQRNTVIDNPVPLDKRSFSSFLRNSILMNDEICKDTIKSSNSKTSEIEVGNTNYN
ncbi:uncharacterized protein LOC112593340 [Melanaphis sacchari]|uniref:uncharacterized protein LOC112593340 n=1 Tax=Melanaphis sacchari TaxID=742174 RepID=UPI000DC13134|nr:uncharacterized protein LOC112593340 [Melanaphis sacchari]